MKTATIVKAVCTAGLSAACVLSMVACTSASGNSTNTSTGGVAATVNGTEISEDVVTTQVESIRAQMSLDTDEAWGTWLVENDYTPEKVREQVIDGYVEQELIRQGAAEKGITADSAEIDSYIDSMKSYYGDDAAWQEALSGAGMTEEDYRKSIELSLLYNNLYSSFATSEEPSEEDLLAYSQMYVSSFDGAKRSSHILFAADDEATAQSVLDKINSGELDFAEAAKEYSTDASAQNGGDVDWDFKNSFVTEYQTALDGLEKDQVSGLVTSSYGIHIIKCTDVFTAPEELTSTDQLPEAILDQVKTAISSAAQSTNYNSWYTEYHDSADIVINDIPADVSYNIDLTPYQTAQTSESESSTNSDGSTTVTNADGSTTTTYADGSTKTVNTDGTSVEVDAEGNTTSYDANGNVVAEATASGTATTTSGADGGTTDTNGAATSGDAGSANTAAN